jgi:hypothetical protein
VSQQVLCSQLPLRCRLSAPNWDALLLVLLACRSTHRISIGDDSMCASATSGAPYLVLRSKAASVSKRHNPSSRANLAQFVCAICESSGPLVSCLRCHYRTNMFPVLPTSTPARFGKQLRKQNKMTLIRCTRSTIASFQKLAVADAKRPTHALWGSLKQATDPSPNCQGHAMIEREREKIFPRNQIDRTATSPGTSIPEGQKRRARRKV